MNTPANTGIAAFTAKADSNTVKGVAAYKADKKNNLSNGIDSSATKTVAANTLADNKSLTLISTRPATAPAAKEQPKVVADNQVSKGMQALFDKEAKNRATQNTEEQKTIDKKVAFGIYAATYVNYAKGSDKQFNTGVGATADIRLTDNLRLSTGVSIGQNTLSYANNNTTAVIPVALMAAASHNFTANSSSVLYSVAPASSNLNANLVNLDIPVDLKYVFNPQKGNTYVSAGFSSGTFINETYNTTYNYNGNGSSIQQTGDATHKSFDNFYFAQMLNVSFGVGYPIGKNQLIIEPFFKYPLNGMGDEHLLFGSGGLNLKFNFDPPKSKH
jgi:phage gpG-like protein